MGFLKKLFKALDTLGKAGAKDRIKRKRISSYDLESPDLKRIIAESVAIIDRTKTLKVALGRFNTIRNSYGRLLAIDPDKSSIEISIGKWVPLQTVTYLSEIMACTEKAKKEYACEFFTAKVNSELLKVEGLTDHKLKLAQLKKALKAALAGKEHLPKDPYINNLVAEVESQISSITL
ncbi:MAG: hypothetical protein U1D97_12440 [Desulfuromonadales bacterium]|nr:hypothetical protein [Desulfuromonadales bacterium]